MDRLSNMGKLLYGGDYNPEQWLEYPDILKKDIAYMKEAHINVVTLGIFAWSSLEPEEGNYQFSWMEERINTLYENGISVILATPSGSRPKWLAEKYPEVLRIDGKDIGSCMGFGTIIAIRRRNTGGWSAGSTRSWQKDSADIRV